MNLSIMRQVCDGLQVVAIERAFNEAGTNAFYLLVETLSELYKHIELSRVTGRIVVFCPIPKEDGFNEPSTGKICTDFSNLINVANDGLTIEVHSGGACYVHPQGTIEPNLIKQSAVVYEYYARQEHFMAKTETSNVIRYIDSADSQYAVPTFFTLTEALRSYASSQIRHSSCPIFNEAWADNHRVFFKPKPESTMRRSLMHFLGIRLGAAYEVRPEQIMDESHPVDLKVTYTLGPRLMIIEIKWVGDSREAPGQNILSHRDARARHGADQLVTYIEQNLGQAPTHVTHAYYVVIDARRRGLNEGTTKISRADGLHYANIDLEFHREYHVERNDFEAPFRMFAEPICTI